MREIKFRGLSRGSWIYGVYAHKPCGDIEQHFIIDWRVNNASSMPDTYFYDNPVNPETVGQYTGLKDKNGKEIYEGDVITNGRDDAVVVFDEGTFLAKIGKYCATESVYNFDYCIVFEVVGNIHENPELLEVSNETL